MALQVMAPIDGLAVRALPRGRFIDTLPELTDEGLGTPSNPRWLGGVTWSPRPCRHLIVDDVEDVCDPNFIADIPYRCVENATQHPFSILNGMWGSVLNFPDQADIDKIIDELGGIELSTVIARQAMSASASPSNSMSFSAQAHAPAKMAFGQAATPVTNAFAVLQDDLALTLGGARGVIHIPPAMLHQAIFRDAVEERDGHYETPLGHLVVADAGYRAAPPPGGQSAAASTEEWIYATGPVAWTATPWVKREGALDITTNFRKRLANAFAIVVFDPCPVTAVLAKYEVA